MIKGTNIGWGRQGGRNKCEMDFSLSSQTDYEVGFLSPPPIDGAYIYTDLVELKWVPFNLYCFKRGPQKPLSYHTLQW